MPRAKALRPCFSKRLRTGCLDALHEARLAVVAIARACPSARHSQTGLCRHGPVLGVKARHAACRIASREFVVRVFIDAGILLDESGLVLAVVIERLIRILVLLSTDEGAVSVGIEIIDHIRIRIVRSSRLRPAAPEHPRAGARAGTRSGARACARGRAALAVQCRSRAADGSQEQ